MVKQEGHYKNKHSHMNGWPLIRRMDDYALGLLEAVCPHGVGHPISESIHAMSLRYPQAGGKASWGLHGCDGCCVPPPGSHEKGSSSLQEASSASNPGEDKLPSHYRVRDEDMASGYL